MKHPKREKVVQTILEHPEWKAGAVAEHVGLIEEMGYDKATDYIKQVRKSMRKKGQLIRKPTMEYTDEERLADVKWLFISRDYVMSKKAASAMLLMMCYWTMRTGGNYKAVSDTMEMNDKLRRPLSFQEIEQVCNLAQERGFDSMAEEKSSQAKIRGFVNAGLNYTSDSLYYKFEVKEAELPHLKTIKKPKSMIMPQGVPEE